MKDIRNDLIEARRLYQSGKYEDALRIFEEHYRENSEMFTRQNRISFAWAIYRVHIRDTADEYELFDNAEFICEITEQADLNSKSTCPYTQSVYRVLKLLNSQEDYYNMVYWLDKINPDLLDQRRNKTDDWVYRSRKELYYDYASKAYLACADYEECIRVSKSALENLNRFTNFGDKWHRWRIAKSLRCLGQNREALKYLEEVIKVKTEWFIYKEIADNHFALNETEKAMENISNAILTNDPIHKVNLYGLVYKLLKECEPEIARKHAELYYLLKLDYQSSNIDEEIENLNMDVEELDMMDLANQIRDYWTDYKFRNTELKFGTVTRYFEEKNYGFIRSEDEKSIFFHKGEFKGDSIYVGQLVSFYEEDSFDKSKNEESIKAVNIKPQ